MNKYIDADRLKLEVEKHIKEVKDVGKRLTPNMGFFDAKLSGIYDVMSIVASLQQEPYIIEEDLVEKRKQECGCRKLSSDGNHQCERYEGVLGPCDGRCSWIVDYPKLKGLEKQQEVDLEKEFNNFLDNVEGVPRMWHSDEQIEWAKDIARHFYELGQKDAANKFDEIEYNKQRTEEEMPDKSLDEAAEEYVQKGHLLTEAFIVIPTFKDGAKWQKEQMMKEAEEEVVKYNDYPEYKYVLVPYEEFNDGDKVRVIIVKEEDK